MMPPPRPRSARSTLLLLLAVAACSAEASTGNQDPKVYTVAARNLPITIKENAELQALRETVVRSQVEGQATIIYLIEEGKVVDQGEKLVELDASELVDKRANQKISVAKAKAALDQAQKNLEILQKELITKLNTAKSNLIITQMELDKFLGKLRSVGISQGKNRDMVEKLQRLVSPADNEPAPAPTPNTGDDGDQLIVTQVDPRGYVGLVAKIRELLANVPHVDPESGAADLRDAQDFDMGDMANKVLQQIDQIRLAMADLKVKEDTLGYSERLAKKQFITRNELDKDRLAYQSQVSKVTLAWNDLDLLINFELFKQKIKLMQDVDNARLELERVKASNDAEETRAQTDFESKSEEFKLASERLENLDRQINNAIVYAPTPGLVIYARLDRGGRSSETIREGTQVRERQDLIILPDTTKMQAIVKVQEAVVSQVRAGQRATLSVEAYPDRVFTGRVTRVAQQADSNSGWMTSDRKVYATTVEFDGDNGDGVLKSRMAAAVTILVDEVPDVLAVPLQAVQRDRSVNFVWKLGPNGSEAVPVQVGRHNSENVVIDKGLAAGDRIYLTTPADAKQVNLPQPEVTVPDPKTEPATPPAPRNAAETGNRGEAGGNRPGGDGEGAARGPGGQGNTRGRGMSQKPFAEMTAEELAEAKTNLGTRYQRMLEMMRSNGQEDAAKGLEELVADAQKALDANKLEDAQAAVDKIRAEMRKAMPQGGPGGPGGQGGGRGNRGGGGSGGPTGGGGGGRGQ